MVSSLQRAPAAGAAAPFATGAASAAAVRSPLDALVCLDDWELSAAAALRAASAERPAQTPAGTLEYYASGAGAEVTLSRNSRVWSDELLLLPRVLVDVACASTRWRLLGCDVSAPFGIAPTAFQRLAHAEGELATSRAAAAAGVSYCVSSFATASLEDVAAAAGGGGAACPEGGEGGAATRPTPGAPPSAREGAAAASRPVRLMQLYAMQNRAVTRSIVERAERTGAFSAIALTVDRPVLGRREANARTRFDIPWELHRDPNDLNGARLAERARCAEDPAGGESSGGQSSLYANVSASLTWEDVAWLRSITSLPIVLKGVLAPEDGAAAVCAGCAAVWVSNHGGRQLDACATGADALPALVSAVRRAEAAAGGPRVEVWVDGGVRRGTDVVKALALGADFVWVGRPVVWGLAVAGEEGVRRVLRTLRDETLNAMQLLGVTRVEQIGPQHLLRLRPAPAPLALEQQKEGKAGLEVRLAAVALVAAAVGWAAGRRLG